MVIDLKKKLFYISVLSIIGLIISRSERIIFYTQKTLDMCYEIIIPSLFPFFVCSALLIYSGFAEVISKYSERIMRPLFNVAPAGAVAFILGILSGFPLGAVCVKDLYKSGNLSKIEAERLLSFCNNSGPLFIIGAIGTAIYLKPLYGIVLYAIHITSSIIVGVIFRGYGKGKHTSPPTLINTNDVPISKAITLALEASSKNILTVCFSVIFFSAIAQTLLELFPISPILNAIATGLCEFSTGVLNISLLREDITLKLILTSFIVGFSGLSVHLQVMSVTADSGLSLKPYILGKALHGIIASAITAIVLFFAKVQPVFSPVEKPLSMSFSMYFAFMFIALCILTFFIIMTINSFHKTRKDKLQKMRLKK